MNRSDVARLQRSQGHPSVSILMPTHRAAPASRQDPIRLRNLVKEASDRLLAEFARREVAPLLEQLEKLAEQVDFRSPQDGLALFVNHETAVTFVLPVTVKPRVVVADSFYTRDLVHALNRSIRYWVLVLSEQPTRLYAGQDRQLEEVQEHGFPLTLVPPERDERMTSGEARRRTEYEIERHRHFFRQVDAAFSKAAATEWIPVVLAGIDRDITYFNEVAKSAARVVATLRGNHDTTSPHELGQLVWPLLQAYLAERRQAQLRALDEAVGAQRYAAGIADVWRAAQEGRGAALLVEEDYHVAATVSADGLTLTVGTDTETADTLADAVDDLIETVLAKGGDVVIVENGALAAYQSVALITRF